MTAPSKCPRCGAEAKHNWVEYQCGLEFDSRHGSSAASTTLPCHVRQIARLRGVLERVTERNRRYYYAFCVCYWCGRQDEYGHTPDCPWREARELLKETSGE